MNPQRRQLLAALAAAPLAGCTRQAPPTPVDARWVGASQARGHRLRESGLAASPVPDVQRSAGALVVGGGIAGLAAARALRRAGIDDVHLLELEDGAGGNSRGHRMAGLECPLGAHYLPLPGPHAVEVAELLGELGLRRVANGAPVYDERHLCHSPQERLFIAGQWQDGLLPTVDLLPASERTDTLAQYRRFGALVAQVSRDQAFAMPTARARWSAGLDALDRQTFAAWLDTQALTAPVLRWYLDYCCRDDYGAGARQVSAWAGVHYFASRHGFHAPGDAEAERDAVLTWPQGNAWLVQRLAEPLGDRLHGGCVAWRVTEGRHDVSVDLWNERDRRHERWTAPQLVLALPLFVAARLLSAVPAALSEVVALQPHAPWLVANLQLDAPLLDRGIGAPPSWDNVVYGSASLGYVDAMHQSVRPVPGPTVLTAYWALGGDSPEQLRAQRQRLLDGAAAEWADIVLADLSSVHPDLRAKVGAIDLMRYGHAMSVPVPGLRSHAALRALADRPGRVQFAHSDLAGYSVFEEALFHGQRAGATVAARLRG